MGTPCDRFTMKLNLSCPTTGMQKCIDVDDDKKLLPFFDKRVAQEVSGDSLGDEFKGYKFRISGGNDKQGVLCPDRVRLLLRKGSKGYRCRRTGEMKRKSVRGCIVAHDLSVLNLVVVSKGPAEIPGLTDESKPVRLGPKRATKIRKLFNLGEDEDVKKFVVRRSVTTKGGKEYKKAPKIQRLVTPLQIHRKKYREGLKSKRAEKNKKERHELLMKRRSSHGSTHSAGK